MASVRSTKNQSLATIATLLLLTCQLAAQVKRNVTLPPTKQKFIVVAHRGDHTHAPENTLQAIQHAIDAGVDYVEIDLRTTKDSQLVIMHDASIDRMTNGKGLVKDSYWSELKNLIVADKQHPEHGQSRIPLFEEVLSLCRNKINIYLDYKAADPAVTFALLRKYGMDKHVIIYINEDAQLTAWQQLAPTIPLMVSPPDTITNRESLVHFIRANDIAVLDGDYIFYNSAFVQAANDAGAIVIPDIQGPNENPALWDKAIRLGIQGLQTDHPAELIRYLKKHKLH